MIIDFHTHLGKGKKVSTEPPAKVDMLLKLQKEAGINKSIVFAITSSCNMYGFDMANEFVLSLKGPFIPFFRANPKIHDKSKLEQWYKKFSFKGIKLHPVLDNYKPTKRTLDDIMNFAIEKRIPVIIHSLWGELGNVKYIEKLAKAFPKAKIVIAHLKEKDAIEAAKRRKNLFLETSYAPHPRRIEEAVKAVGAKRILFGSDYPFNDPFIMKLMVERAKISKREKELILGKNAAKLLRLR